MPIKSLSIRIDDKTLDKLHVVADYEGRSANSQILILIRDAIEKYGVWQEKKQYGKVSMGVVRTTYIIGGDGRIQAVMPKVKPDTNAAEILANI